MANLKKLMDDYRLRINDPSYVAPKEIRGVHRSHASPTVHSEAIPHKANNSAQDDNSPRLPFVEGVDEPGKASLADLENERRFYNNPEAQELARRLGVDFKDGLPDLSVEQEDEMTKAVDKEDIPVTSEEQAKLWRLFMTGEDY